MPPASSPPAPSPIHHTPRAQGTEAASAARTVGRHSSPAASSSWIVANSVFQMTGCAATRLADQDTGPWTTAGLPSPAGARTSRANAGVNM